MQHQEILPQHRQKAKQEWFAALKQTMPNKDDNQLHMVTEKMEAGVFAKSTYLSDYLLKNKERIESSVQKLVQGKQGLLSPQQQAQIAAKAMQQQQQQQQMGMHGMNDMQGLGMSHMGAMQQQAGSMMQQQMGMQMPGMMPQRAYSSQPPMNMAGGGQQGHMGQMTPNALQANQQAYQPQQASRKQGATVDNGNNEDFMDFLSTFTNDAPAGNNGAMNNAMPMNTPPGMIPMGAQQPLQATGGYNAPAGMHNQQYGMQGASHFNAGMQQQSQGVGQQGMNAFGQNMHGFGQQSRAGPGQLPQNTTGPMQAQQRQQQTQQFGNLPGWPQQGNQQHQQQQQQLAGLPGGQNRQTMPYNQQGGGGMQGAPSANNLQQPGTPQLPPGHTPLGPNEELFWRLHGEMRERYLKTMETYLGKLQHALKPRPGGPTIDETQLKKTRDRMDLFRDIVNALAHTRGSPQAPIASKEMFAKLAKWRSTVCKSLDERFGAGAAAAQAQSQASAAGQPGGAAAPSAAAVDPAKAAAALQAAIARNTQQGMTPPLANTPGGLAPLPAPTPQPNNTNMPTPPPALPMPTPNLLPTTGAGVPSAASNSAVAPPPAAANVEQAGQQQTAPPAGLPAVAEAPADNLPRVLQLLETMEAAAGSVSFATRLREEKPSIPTGMLPAHDMITPPIPVWLLPPEMQTNAAGSPSNQQGGSDMLLSQCSFICQPGDIGPQPYVQASHSSQQGTTTGQQASQGQHVDDYDSDGSDWEDPAILSVLQPENSSAVNDGTDATVPRKRRRLDTGTLSEICRQAQLAGCVLEPSLQPCHFGPAVVQLQLKPVPADDKSMPGWAVNHADKTNKSDLAWRTLHVCVSAAALQPRLTSDHTASQPLDVGNVRCLPVQLSTDPSYNDPRTRMAHSHLQAALTSDDKQNAGSAATLRQVSAAWQHATASVQAAIAAAPTAADSRAANPPLGQSHRHRGSVSTFAAGTPSATPPLAAVG